MLGAPRRIDRGNAPRITAVGGGVVDLVRAILIVAAIVASAKARYRGGIVIAGAFGVLFAIEVALPLCFPLRPAALQIAFGAIFLGPSSLPHASPFAPSELLTDPTHHVVAALLAGLGARGAFLRASMLPPDGDDSRAWDRAGLRFVALGVMLGLMSISGLLVHTLGGDP